MCPCVRPSVQKPIALESVDFASPKLRGSEKRDSIIVTVFALKSVDFVSQEGVATKKSLPPVKAFLFFCEIHSSHIFPAVSPQRGLTTTSENSRVERARVVGFVAPLHVLCNREQSRENLSTRGTEGSTPLASTGAREKAQSGRSTRAAQIPSRSDRVWDVPIFEQTN